MSCPRVKEERGRGVSPQTETFWPEETQKPHRDLENIGVGRTCETVNTRWERAKLSCNGVRHIRIETLPHDQPLAPSQWLEMN